MTRCLALIGAVSLFWMLGFTKPSVGMFGLTAFLTGYATARMANVNH